MSGVNNPNVLRSTGFYFQLALPLYLPGERGDNESVGLSAVESKRASTRYDPLLSSALGAPREIVIGFHAVALA